MTTPATIWYTRCPVPTTSGIAQHFGWLEREFARHGVAVESIRAAADRSVRQSHFDHSHANQFREGGNVPPLWTRGEGRDTVVVGITWVDEEQLVLVRDDGPLQRAGDLAGARLGLPLHASRIVDIGRAEDLRGLLAALRIGGIARDAVQFVDLPGGDFDLRERRDGGGEKLRLGAEALLEGRVDAIYAKGAFSATLIERHGFRPIVDINQQPDPLLRVNAGTPRPVTVNRELARDHPEIVARYLAVLGRTAEWARSHPAEVVRAIAAETDASEAAVRRGFGPHLHERFAVTLSEVSVAGLRAQKEFLVAEGFVKDFDFDGWIDPAPLALASRLIDDVAPVGVEETAKAA